MRQIGVSGATPEAIIEQKKGRKKQREKKQPERSAEGPRHSG